MVHLRNEQFLVGTYNKLMLKKLGLFLILKHLGENAYLVDLPSDIKISPIFNVSDLHPYYPPDSAPVFVEKLKDEFSPGRKDLLESTTTIVEEVKT